ncbi:nucleolar protein 8-like isoform X2 [Centruroides sculpturatus]|nr:nucleolar protein 8-like isoform X2 [Centruroides sculpturatus]XP_023232696.1 nucleolar protein 8-like isoform X2 [Centruroides sculpturatus]XP_023232697.1 nucleolar protein 8-like isoform X2 [Centruroides sculpturatus]XP_023232698.1 nucleolar protein 8-like isoform X2 [Centruroides sculpturatus]
MERTTDVFVNSSLSNKKRLSSQQLNEKKYKAQQYQIKAALAKIDCKTSLNKKVVFDSDEDEIKQPSKIYNGQLEKRKLFDDSDSDESENESKLTKEQNLNDLFRVRAQFEGKKGQKLLELQTRFKNDERFQLDERFLESDDDGGNEKEGLEKLETMDILEERKRNFEILQNVIGVQFPIEPSNKKLKQNYKDMNKLRYDPTSEDAKKFELKREPKQKDSLKK